MCEWGLWGCLCSHQIQQPQCLLAISTGSSPLHQTHGNLWISIFSKSCWASDWQSELRKSAGSALMMFSAVFLLYSVFYILYYIILQNNWKRCESKATSLFSSIYLVLLLQVVRSHQRVELYQFLMEEGGMNISDPFNITFSQNDSAKMSSSHFAASWYHQ